MGGVLLGSNLGHYRGMRGMHQHTNERTDRQDRQGVVRIVVRDSRVLIS
jgi:hypothetical protein